MVIKFDRCRVADLFNDSIVAVAVVAVPSTCRLFLAEGSDAPVQALGQHVPAHTAD